MLGVNMCALGLGDAMVKQMCLERCIMCVFKDVRNIILIVNNLYWNALVLCYGILVGEGGGGRHVPPWSYR